MSQFMNGSYIGEPTSLSRVLVSSKGNHTFNLVPVGTATGTNTSQAFSTEGVINAVIFDIDVLTVAGTTPTMTINLQNSPDNSAYTTEASSSSFTAAGSQRIMALLDPGSNFVRAQFVIGGTTPSFKFNVRATPFVICG